MAELSTAQVREEHAAHATEFGQPREVAYEWFDRWLAEHDREVGQKAQDEFRRFLWIIADRHIGGLLISDAELTAVPNLPGIAIDYDPVRRLTTIRATSTDTSSPVGAMIETERAGSVADGNSNTPRGAVVESGVQPDAGEVDAEFESRPGPLVAPRASDDVGGGA